MKKRLLFLALTLALVLPCLFITAGAETVTGTCGPELTWSLDTVSGAFTIEGTGPMTNYKHPTYANYPSDLPPWADHKDSIRTVKFAEGVTSVGGYAFYGCESLNHAAFPGSLISLGAGAFDSCKGLEAVTLQDGVQSIGASAFYGCSSLTQVELPESITAMGASAFSACTALEEVDLPEDIEVLDYTFENCYALRKVDLPDRLLTMNATFNRCFALEEVTIPEGVQSIGRYTFQSCGLTEICIPESVESIGLYAFENCDNLIRAEVRGGNIAGYMFMGCTNLRSVEILSRDAVSIGSMAFENCCNLTEIFIPANVTTIYSRAFANFLMVDSSPVTVVMCGTMETVYGTYTQVKEVYLFGEEDEVPAGVKNAFPNAVWYYGDPREPVSVSLRGDKVVAAGETTRFYATVGPKTAIDRSVTWTSSDPSVATVDEKGKVTGVKSGTATITATTCNGKTASQKIRVDGDELVITVKGYQEEKILTVPNYKPEPLAGATVVIGNTKKMTNAEGVARFKPTELPKGSAPKITISCGELYEVKETCLYDSTRKEHSFNLKMLSCDIRFQAVSARLDGENQDLLAGSARKYVNYLDQEGVGLNTQATRLDITVDWGRHKENTAARKLWLSGERGQQVSMKEGANFVVLTNYFDEGETLTLHAITKDEKGNEVRVDRVIPLTLKALNVNLPVKDTESVSMKDLSYLNNLTAEVKVGDLMGWGGKVEVENGVLTVEFGKTDKSVQKEVSLFDGFLDGKSGPEVQLSGRVQIPITKTGAGTWSGGVFMFVGDSAQAGDIEQFPAAGGKKSANRMVNLFKNTYNFTISGVPLYVDSSLRAGLEGALNVGGTFDTVGVNGKLEPQGEFTLGGGVGVGYDVGEDELAVKFGAEGGLEVKLPVTYTLQLEPQLDTLASFDPEIKGSVSAKLVLKVMAVDLEGKLELGRVVWNKNGATWWAVGEEGGELFTLSDDDWRIADRDYLANGGGFIGDANCAVLLSRDDGEQTVYENISPNADGVLTLMDGVPVLLFTVDDTEREAANALKLVYSRYVDGAWTAPAAVADDGTLDTAADGDGKFVVWENSNTAFDADLTLETMLAANDIAVGIWNGESYDVTTLTANVGYEFGPKVAVDGDKAVVAWLSNSEGDLTGQTGTTSIHYSTYTGSWSWVRTVSNVGAVTNLEVSGSAVYFKVGDQPYSVSVTYPTGYPMSPPTAYPMKDAGVGRYAWNGDILAWLDGEKTLHIKKNGTEVAAIQTAWCGSENPVLAASEQGNYLFWTDEAGLCYTTNVNGGWTEKLVLDDSDAIFSSISAAVTEDGCLVSYFRTENGKTNLVVRNLVGGVELSADGITYDSAAYADSGRVRSTITLTNSGQLSARDIYVNFYEGDALVYQGEVPGGVAPGESRECILTFSPEDSSVAHDYRVVVSAEGDSSEEDNGLELHVGGVDLSLAQAWFGRDDLGAGQLTVLVENLGDLDVESAQVKVCKNDPDSAPVAELDTGLVRSGSVVQLTLPQEQDKEALYYVTLFAEGDGVAYNDVTLLAYDNVENLNAELSASQEGTTVTAVVRPNDLQIKEAALIWAVYDSNGKLKETAVETVDLSAGAQAVGKELPTLAAEDRVAVMLADPAQGLKPLGSKTVFTAE